MATKVLDRIAYVPAWILSISAALLAAVIINQLKNDVPVTYTYIIWCLILVFASFLICIIHPGHVWLVPLLCNILALLPAIFDETFWSSSFGMIIGSGILCSFLAARLGSITGRWIRGRTSK